MVRRVVGRVLGPDRDVDDVVQETFLHVVRGIDSFRGEPGQISGWIKQIAVFRAQKTLRYRRVRRWLRLTATGELPERQHAQRQEVALAMRRAYAILDTIALRDRAAFVLRYIEQMTIPEIVEATSSAPTTVKRRIAQLGHDIAAHQDVTAPPKDPAAREAFLRQADEVPMVQRQHTLAIAAAAGLLLFGAAIYAQTTLQPRTPDAADAPRAQAPAKEIRSRPAAPLIVKPAPKIEPAPQRETARRLPLHMVGIYETRDRGGLATVTLQAQGPSVLLLSAYEPTRWRVRLAPGAKLERVILNGYHRQELAAIEALDPNQRARPIEVPYTVWSHEPQWDDYLETVHSWSGLEAEPDCPITDDDDVQECALHDTLLGLIEHRTEAALTSFHGCYSMSQVTISAEAQDRDTAHDCDTEAGYALSRMYR